MCASSIATAGQKPRADLDTKCIAMAIFTKCSRRPHKLISSSGIECRLHSMQFDVVATNIYMLTGLWTSNRCVRQASRLFDSHVDLFQLCLTWYLMCHSKDDMDLQDSPTW